NHAGGAAGVAHGAVHPALLVLEDPELGTALRQPRLDPRRVLGRNPEQDQEARADTRQLMALDAHRRAAHALEQRPHEEASASPRRRAFQKISHRSTASTPPTRSIARIAPSR